MSEEKLEEINSIAEFMEKLNKVKELERYKNLEIVRVNNKTYKYTIDLFYRGHSNKEYQLIPSIERINKQTYNKVTATEYTLIFKAKNEYPTLFSETDNPLDLLVKLQHYGIPTRLLDITSNPLVALYFSCNNNLNIDGEIFIFGCHFAQSYNDAMVERLIKLLARNDIFSTKAINVDNLFLMLNKDFKFNTVTIKALIKQNNWEDSLKNAINLVHFIYPPRLFERLHLQQGHFILFLNDYKYDEVKQILRLNNNLSPIPKGYKNIIARYIIPAKSKKHLLEELKMLNITESTLFHDDVDRVCRNIVADFKGRYGK